MKLPQFEDRTSSPPAFSARQILTARRKAAPLDLPEAAILLFQGSPLRRRRLQRVRNSGLPGDLYLATEKKIPVAVLTHFGLGAPAAVLALEMLAACGVRRLISLGTAGSLQPDLDPGALALCERALRDEGTSYHYLPAAPSAAAAPALIDALEHALHRLGASSRRGASWTTDAPFRETLTEIHHYQQMGLLTVEMEAAALFAAGMALNVQVAAGLVISDHPGAGPHNETALPDWSTKPGKQRIEHSLNLLFTAALAALSIPGTISPNRGMPA